MARGYRSDRARRGDDLLQLAAEAIARGADVIGMAGGDGSQALVATVASKHGIPHVCVPAGTRNHFALDLGLDRDDVVGALDAFHDGLERRVDLARVNGRVFVNNASMGLYAKIVQSPAYRDAKMKTAAELAAGHDRPRRPPVRPALPRTQWCRIPHRPPAAGVEQPLRAEPSWRAGHARPAGPRSLGVVAARIAGPKEAVTFVGLEATGRIRSFSGWLEWDTPIFRIDSAGPIEIGVDGEALLMDPPLLFESLPGVLRVRIPSHAPGSAPAATAVQLTGSTIGDLIRTAAGRAVGSP